jgi:histidinol-phosphate aminotransferase
LRTFSKAFRLAAHRVGYVIAHPEVTAVLEKVRLPYNLPTFSQLAARTALLHRQELLGSVPDLLQQRRQLLEVLSQHPSLRVFPSDANFIYVQLCSHQVSSKETTLQSICAELKHQGTLIRQINGGLRITIGNPEENQRLLKRLYDALSRSGLTS